MSGAKYHLRRSTVEVSERHSKADSQLFFLKDNCLTIFEATSKLKVFAGNRKNIAAGLNRWSELLTVISQKVDKYRKSKFVKNGPMIVHSVSY